jgi:hypothetical protein
MIYITVLCIEDQVSRLCVFYWNLGSILALILGMGVVDNASDENNENTRRKATVVPIKIEYV